MNLGFEENPPNTWPPEIHVSRIPTDDFRWEAMVGLKSSPGSQNGTGLLQTVIAMKVLDGLDTPWKTKHGSPQKYPIEKAGKSFSKPSLLCSMLIFRSV